MTPTEATIFLGAGQAPELPLLRLVLGLIFCVLVAFAAAHLLRRSQMLKRGPASLGAWLRLPARELTVLETVRLGVHGEACRLAYRGAEYLVVVSAGGPLLLSQAPALAAPNEAQQS